MSYQNLIVRGNRIRPVDGVAPVSGLQGIKLSVDKLTIDNNLVDASTPDNSVQRGSANSVQVFNNRTLAGAFLPVSIIGGASHQSELTTEAELMYATL